MPRLRNRIPPSIRKSSLSINEIEPASINEIGPISINEIEPTSINEIELVD